MESDTLDIADRPVATATFRNDVGDLEDPGTVVFLLRRPDGRETAHQFGLDGDVTRVSLGVFRFVLPTFTKAGPWTVRANATAGLIAGVETNINVRPSAFKKPNG